MQLFEVAALTAAAVNSTLALFVLWQNWRSPLHRAYFLWGVGVALWNISAFFLYQPIDKSVALLWAKLLQFGIIIAPVGLYETARLISGRGRRGMLVFCLYGLHGLFILSLATGWFISDVRWITFGYWSMPGPLFWAYVVSYLILTSGAQLHLFRAQRSGNRSERIRIRALLAAIVCIWIAGTNDLLPILGIDSYRPFLDVNFYPLGSVAACIYMTIVAYSVLQHTLLDVHVVLGRVSAHVVRIGFLTLTGMCLLLLAAGITGEFTGTSFFSALSVVGLSALTASIFFPRLFGDGPQSFEQRILGDRFEYQDKVRSFNLQMSWYVDLDALLDDLHTLLTKTFRIEKYSILLSDESNQQLSSARRYPDEGREPPTLKATSPVFQYFEWGKGEYLSLNSMYLRLGASPVERSAREQMIGFDADFCFPLAWQHEPFGLLLVGAKTAGEPYSATDINLLIALAKNLSMVVNQIRLKTQILHVQELDLLGRMSRGMAHDLNNLLTPVSTLLQLATENGSCDAELLPTALRNISTMQAYIRESLFFSEHPHPELSMDRLDLVIHQTVQLTRGTRKKEVEIIADTPGEVVAEMNGVLIQRLLINLISNAVDASAPGTTVRVRLATFKSGLAKDEWVRVQVIDQGEGISRENMNRVQRPYFTTKDRGDENRGFGLGLAICRKIVTLHGGHLEIESELERGTTVQVDLPRYRIASIGTERPSLISFSASA
jgi:signal transduction histidine kinase